MNDWLILVHLAVAVVAIAVLIIGAKLTPAIALLLGTIYLGLATSLGPVATMEAVADGFGGLMAEVGLIIGLGVLMGSLMTASGAIESIVSMILRVFGRRGSPYAYGLSISTVLPSIYFDVLLVLMAPLARRTAARTGQSIAALGGPISIGLMGANSLVVPGSAALAYAGALSVPIGTMFGFGIGVAIVAVTATIALWLLLLRAGFWNAERDEQLATAGETAPSTAEQERTTPEPPPLLIALAPVLVALGLILIGTVGVADDGSAPVREFLGNPIVALLAGTLVALLIARLRTTRDVTESSIEDALRTSGTILVVTGVAGSLGAVIEASEVGTAVRTMFAAGIPSPLVLTWLIAAAMRTAQGAATVSGITAIGIIAPFAAGSGLDPVLIALAAGAGACFGGNLSDNAFWMFRSFLGLTTRGTLKAYTMTQSMLSVLTLLVTLGLSVLI